jgi:hypothetical protein
MNSKRNNFELPKNHQINFTPYWLIGFTEGEGSFSLSSVNFYSFEILS